MIWDHRVVDALSVPEVLSEFRLEWHEHTLVLDHKNPQRFIFINLEDGYYVFRAYDKGVHIDTQWAKFNQLVEAATAVWDR